jgi:hypothetical protein
MTALITFCKLIGSSREATFDFFCSLGLIKENNEKRARETPVRKGINPEPGSLSVPRPILIEARHTIIAMMIRTPLLIK